MAKVTFAKLGLTKNIDTIPFLWNDQTIEVKQYLPIAEKLELISKIVALSMDTNGFFNPCRIDIFSTLEIFFAYTGINLTEKQKEDVIKIYDLLVSSGFIDELYSYIPEEELDYINNAVIKQIESIYSYKNSVLGIMETVAKDYENINFTTEKLREVLTDETALGTVKEVITKLD